MKIAWPTVAASLAIAILPASARAQATAPANPPKPRFGHAVRSPEVDADGRVTFRFRAPGAKEVAVFREGEPKLAMTRDDHGVWSATTDKLPPDFYTYTFVVDGVVLADPSNPLCKPIVSGGNESLVHVPGRASLPWEVNDVPHGTLHRHVHNSKVIGEAREFLVYTPPGYDAADPRRYPVLYLLHGVMDDATAWTTAGRADVILDNLVAQRKAKPMVVVMPLGYGFTNVPDRVGEQFGGPSVQKKFLDAMSGYVLGELIPAVEGSYRVAPDRDSRAIAGLSMGGAQALYIGLNHPDRFAWIGSFSGALTMYGGPYAKWFPGVVAESRPEVRLLWTSCGSADFLLGANRKFIDWLKSNGVRCTLTETPGAHAWPVWRRNLCDFASQLFQEKTVPAQR
jgi:enterochelin esterase family protein